MFAIVYIFTVSNGKEKETTRQEDSPVFPLRYPHFICFLVIICNCLPVDESTHHHHPVRLFF